MGIEYLLLAPSIKDNCYNFKYGYIYYSFYEVYSVITICKNDRDLFFLLYFLMHCIKRYKKIHKLT